MLEDDESQRKGIPIINNIPSYREKCTLYDGREFLCDTNFQTSKAMSVQELLDEVPEGVTHICLTGGEPLDRDLEPLLTTLAEETDCKVHIETSGTIDILKAYQVFVYRDLFDEDHPNGWIWLTVSPKKNVLAGMLELASEVKLLVDETFDIMNLPLLLLKHELVWLQPVNHEYEINYDNVKRCLKLLEEHPSWRMSMQMHKLWKVR
jgi:organic radical activating enzyme